MPDEYEKRKKLYNPYRMMQVQLTQTEQKLLAQKGIEYFSTQELTDI